MNITSKRVASDNNEFVLKLYFEGHAKDDGQLRRIRLPCIMDSEGKISYEKLIAFVIEAFMKDRIPTCFSKYGVNLTYRDVDSDLIRIGSTDELVDAIDQFWNQGSLRLFAAVEGEEKKGEQKQENSGCVDSCTETEQQQDHVRSDVQSFVNSTRATTTEASSSTMAIPSVSPFSTQAQNSTPGEISSTVPHTDASELFSSVESDYKNRNEASYLEREIDDIDVANEKNHKYEAEQSKRQQPSTEVRFIHGRHTCDGCLVAPIVGRRYHAVNRLDCDLCENCIGNYEHDEVEFEVVESDLDRRLQNRWRRQLAKKTRRSDNNQQRQNGTSSRRALGRRSSASFSFPSPCAPPVPSIRRRRASFVSSSDTHSRQDEEYLLSQHSSSTRHGHNPSVMPRHRHGSQVFPTSSNRGPQEQHEYRDSHPDPLFQNYSLDEDEAGHSNEKRNENRISERLSPKSIVDGVRDMAFSRADQEGNSKEIAEGAIGESSTKSTRDNMEEFQTDQPLIPPFRETSFSADAAGHGSVAEALGETLDKCADAINEMVLEFQRVSFEEKEKETEMSGDESFTFEDEEGDREVVVKPVTDLACVGEMIPGGNEKEEREAKTAATDYAVNHFNAVENARTQDRRGTLVGNEEEKCALEPSKVISEGFIHGAYTCDTCLMAPIVGKRYHATNWPDYDLCEKCIGKYEGTEIKFEVVELEKDRPFQERWRRRLERLAKRRGSTAQPIPCRASRSGYIY